MDWNHVDENTWDDFALYEVWRIPRRKCNRKDMRLSQDVRRDILSYVGTTTEDAARASCENSNPIAYSEAELKRAERRMGRERGRRRKRALVNKFFEPPANAE
eukprot:CAMPEP_0197248408 /NCGR_PEP_ID=MMETSP1429-20130617/38747_1 /TAXON_ID=49237 /ORGANISM="Chaetoceros  sp., Strain UNC1202" /LENGTH=102 /DNA_ID=CAMNT_0042709613 /DNA_START=271 /DNA_END=579 /DNA_ORIENTATION=-